MSSDRNSHIVFVKGNPFTFSVRKHGFSENEIRFIEKFGSWLDALTKGQLVPISDEQRLFVKEMHSRDEPSLPQVRLWKRYLRRAIEEKDERGVLNSSPPEIEDNTFYSREGYKELHRGQFKTIRDTHRN
jgi:uncharacterized protein YifE (UPF0438 family)